MTAVWLIVSHLMRKEKHKLQLTSGVKTCFILVEKFQRLCKYAEMDNRHNVQNRFFILVGTSSSYLWKIQSLFIPTTTGLVFLMTKRENVKTQLLLLRFTDIKLPCMGCIIQPALPLLRWSIAQWFQQVLVNCCFQSRIVNQADLITPSLLGEILNFVNSSLFWLLTLFYNLSIRTLALLTHNVTIQSLKIKYLVKVIIISYLLTLLKQSRESKKPNWWSQIKWSCK